MGWAPGLCLGSAACGRLAALTRVFIVWILAVIWHDYCSAPCAYIPGLPPALGLARARPLPGPLQGRLGELPCLVLPCRAARGPAQAEGTHGDPGSGVLGPPLRCNPPDVT